MLSIVEALREELSSIYGKTLLEDQGLFYSLLIYIRREPRYIICLPKKTRRALYVKIADINRISSLDCSMLLYDPNGLYVFAKDLEGLVERIKGKIERL